MKKFTFVLMVIMLFAFCGCVASVSNNQNELPLNKQINAQIVSVTNMYIVENFTRDIPNSYVSIVYLVLEFDKNLDEKEIDKLLVENTGLTVDWEYSNELKTKNSNFVTGGQYGLYDMIAEISHGRTYSDEDSGYEIRGNKALVWCAVQLNGVASIKDGFVTIHLNEINKDVNDNTRVADNSIRISVKAKYFKTRDEIFESVFKKE